MSRNKAKGVKSNKPKDNKSEQREMVLKQSLTKMKRIVVILSVILITCIALVIYLLIPKNEAIPQLNDRVNNKTTINKTIPKVDKQTAADITTKNKQENPNAPEINFEKTVHDYGTITKDGNGNSEFIFTNKGQTPILLTKVRSSCGCTVPLWPKEPILPSKTGIIKVKYDTKRIGTFSKSITVISNARNSPVVLKIKGNVISKQ